MEIEILNSSGAKSIGKIEVKEGTTIYNVKEKIQQLKKSLYPDRQAIKLEAKGKALKDDESLKSLNIHNGSQLYVKDLGPQISWKNVFLAEYAGPIFVYLWVYQRPWILYGAQAKLPGSIATLAAVFWCGHYLKRILETLYVHRFSHGTMPVRNLFKNCSYYWLFTLYVAYHVNHPLYTEPSSILFFIGFSGFLLCEMGNGFAHILLRKLRPPGTKIRRIPNPDSIIFNKLFNYVSCPNYTYEVGSWFFFTIMTQCLPVGLFAAAGFYQMAIWAIGKHRNYKKEFPDYPNNRKAIIPFIL